MTPQDRSDALEQFIADLGVSEEELAYWESYEVKGLGHIQETEWN